MREVLGLVSLVATSHTAVTFVLTETLLCAWRCLQLDATSCVGPSLG